LFRRWKTLKMVWVRREGMGEKETRKKQGSSIPKVVGKGRAKGKPGVLAKEKGC